MVAAGRFFLAGLGLKADIAGAPLPFSDVNAIDKNELDIGAGSRMSGRLPTAPM